MQNIFFIVRGKVLFQIRTFLIVNLYWALII